MVQSVKEHVQQGADKRAAGELEGARPASNTINRRPKVLIHQRLLEQSSILIISKCSADEACQKKSSQDFFDKLDSPGAISHRGCFAVCGGWGRRRGHPVVYYCLWCMLSFPLCSCLPSGDPFGAARHCLAAARSRRGSDMPPACHSLPRRRFATLRGAALRGKDLGRSADFSCVAARKNGTVQAVPFTLFNSQIRRRG